jgi:hypothetical protein
MPTADRLLEQILPRRKFLPAQKLDKISDISPRSPQKLTREHRAEEAKVAGRTGLSLSAGRAFNLILASDVRSMGSHDDRVTIGRV